jgi:hypothetical protein
LGREIAGKTIPSGEDRPSTGDSEVEITAGRRKVYLKTGEAI